MRQLLIAIAACAAGLVFAGVLLAAAPAAQSPRADFYVSADGNDAWSGTLAAPNADRTDGPLATLTRARDALRPRIAAGLAAPVMVLVRGGTYMLPDGLALGPEDSGTPQHAVTWAAWPGEVPVLVGGVRLTGWQTHAGRILAAPLPPGAKPNQLFEAGVRMDLARVPDEGYLHVESPVAGNERRAFVYRAGDLDPKAWDLAGVTVYCWPNHDWHSAEVPLASIDAATRTVTLGRNVDALRPGNRYVIRNLLAALDRPGEARIDLAAGKAYAWPRAAGGALAPSSPRAGSPDPARGASPPIPRAGSPDPARSGGVRAEVAGQETRHPGDSAPDIVAATARHVLRIEGQGPDRPVRNVHFTGFDFTIAAGDVIRITGAEDCSVRFSGVTGGGECGVAITGWARRVTVYGNHIAQNGHHGVSLVGGWAGQPDINRENVVENNHIHHCGRLVGHGYGVQIQQSGSNRIVHNHIHHMPRYAASIKGPRYQVLREQVKGVTWENHYDFLHGRKNIIAYNHMHHVNEDSQDTGAFEAWGPGRDNVLDHNLIHDAGNERFDIQSGIYLDDAADHFTVTNCIIYGVVGTRGNQPVFAKGVGNRFENNIFVVGPANDAGIRSFYMADERVDNHEYLRNIIVFEGEPARDKGSFGSGVGAIHDRGKTLRWQVSAPAAGAYSLWMLYAARNKADGTGNISGATAMQAAGGPAVTLQNLPDTGGWGDFRWSRSAEMTLAAGPQMVTWTNIKGGGLNWDAFALADDPAWTPAGNTLPPAAAGRHVVLVQAETHERDGAARDPRAVYWFQNWSEDRVAASDCNIFWKPGGGEIFVRGGPGDGAWEKWRAIGGGRYDGKSLLADPGFVDLAGRDFRLRPDSPALKLGFKPIDTSRIGLKADFPARFPRR